PPAVIRRLSERRIPEHCRHVDVCDRNFAWTRAALEVRREQQPPRVGGLLALGFRHRGLHQLLGFRECSRCHGWPGSRSRAPRRRSSGGGWRRLRIGRRRLVSTSGGGHEKPQRGAKKKLTSSVHRMTSVLPPAYWSKSGALIAANTQL